ncbi:MAG: peptidoglycan DD-metalloendopeptidase family protein [Gemmatimonadota bacterium]
MSFPSPFARGAAARRGLVLSGLVLTALVGCETAEVVVDRYRDLTPHEAYLRGLYESGLAETALARDWIAAARAAAAAPVPVGLPFREEALVTPEKPRAVAYRVEVGRGRRLVVEVSRSGADPARVFVDVFRIPEDDENPLRPVASGDTLPARLEYEPWRGGSFLVRVQPELLRGGVYTVTLRLEAQLEFPVAGLDVSAIRSVFGAPREGGRRTHHGVDIFALRGTPVLAAARGVIRDVDITRLGGKVVWLYDPARRASLYYAHLDSQAVTPGARVNPGDTVGFVGNTGNARTTPPHLHFGLYRRGEGPVDPTPFIRRPRGRVALKPRGGDHLGAWVRVREEGIRLRAGPSRRTAVLKELDPATPVRVLGGAGPWFRVALSDGLQGYVAARLTEEAPAATGAAVSSASPDGLDSY